MPFSFTAGDRMLPAGTYSFSKLLAYPEILKIQNADTCVPPILVQTRIGDSTGTPNVVFDRVGGRHFLREVSTHGISVWTSPSDAEKLWINSIESQSGTGVVGQ